MTNKEFKANIDSLAMSIFSVCKSMNEKNDAQFNDSMTVFYQKLYECLIPFGIAGSNRIAISTLSRVISFKTDKETGEKAFHVSGSMIRRFIKEQVLNVEVPDWESMIEKASAKKASAKKEQSKEKAIELFTLDELKAIVAAKEAEKVPVTVNA